MSNKFVHKVLKNDDKFIIFYSEWCGYSMRAVNLLQETNQTFKGYKIDKIDGGKEELVAKLSEGKDRLDFDPTWSTRPMVFHNGKFVGGFTELQSYLAKMKN